MTMRIAAAAAVLIVYCSAAVAADEVAEKYVPPKAGTQVTNRTTDDHGSVSTDTRIVTETTYKDKPVIEFSSLDGNDITVFDRLSGSYIATVLNGKETEYLEYHESQTRMQWPIKLGAKWTESTTVFDRKSGKSWDPVEENWKVSAYEQVMVPAGMFLAFKLESSPGKNNATKLTQWYVPAIGFRVKQITERTAQHYLGYAKFTTEAIEYKPGQ